VQIATQKGLVLCFRAMMNTPVGMEAIVHDAEPLELMGMSVFLANSPESWLIQSVGGSCQSFAFPVVVLFAQRPI
jgi:hypothetical protein